MKQTALIVGIVSLFSLSQALAQPGPAMTDEHKILKNDVGAWDAKMKIWPQGPDGPVIEGDCEETNRLMTGGLWLISDFKGTFSGVKFEGHGTFGYDPEKKKHVGTWIDNMNPAVSLMEGDYDAETKTMTMYSTGIDPNTRKKTKTKSVGKSIDENTRTFTMSNLAEGSEDKYVKMMEINYTRKK